MMNKLNQNRIYDTVMLYRVVYLSRFVFVTVFILLLSFLMQPIDRAFASEEDDMVPTEQVAEAAPEPESVPEIAEKIVDEEAAPEVVEQAVVEDESVVAVGEKTVTEEVVETASSSDLEESEPGSETDVAVPEGGDVVAADTTEVTESNSTTTEEAVEAAEEDVIEETVGEEEVVAEDVSRGSGSLSTSEETIDNDSASSSGEAVVVEDKNASSSAPELNESEADAAQINDEVDVVVAKTTGENTTDDSANDNAVTTENTDKAADEEDTDTTDEDAAAQTASTTELAPEAVTVEANTVINDDNRHQFSVNECISVGDGSYYCSKGDVESVSSIVDSGVYADYDAEGDKEIFYKVGKQVVQITDNQYDDDAPYLDSVLEIIVWQRLVNGRYQVMYYDIDDAEEVQLTNTGSNNMEPATADGVVVWQRWVQNNWEIVMYADSEETQLSSNEQHDVAPSVRDGYVMWHTLAADGVKQLVVYEIETGLTSNVADPDGGHVENPRFVLVYDTVLENGDIVTKEYDPETGTVRPLTSDPAPLPTKIPDPEPVEEAKALVGVKVNGKDDVLEETTSTTSDPDDTSDTTVVSGNEGTATASSTEESAEPVVDLSGADDEIIELTEFDLIVEPFSATSSAQATATGSTTDSVE